MDGTETRRVKNIKGWKKKKARMVWQKVMIWNNKKDDKHEESKKNGVVKGRGW